MQGQKMNDDRKNKVAIFISEIMWTTHLGTGLEIVQNHLNAGDEVVQFVCNSFLHVCDQNINGSKKICNLCIHKRKKGVSLLSEKVKSVEIYYEDRNYGYVKPHLDLAGLKQIKHKDFDVGMAAASSLISLTRDASISVQEYSDMLSELVNKSSGLYDFFIEKLTIEKPDIVYVFNGRLIYDRALLRACTSLNITYRIFDGAYDVDKYCLVENASLHDITDFEKRATELWNNSDKTFKEKKETGESFFLNSRFGSAKMRAYFVDKQHDKLLPEGWDDSLNNIVCYLSSEDEFAAIGDQWIMDLYASQVDGLRQITNSIKEIKDTKLYIRVHPNSLNTNPTFIKSVYDLASPQVIIILPDSPVSSYSLMLSAKKVLTFGSSIGLEATFWGKPSINLGKSFYMNMGVSYNPTSHQEVLNLIQSDDLEPLPRDNTLQYGYFFMVDGYDYKYYSPIDHGKGYFKGVDLHKYNMPLLHRIRKQIKSLTPAVIINIYNRIRYKQPESSAVL